MPEGQATSGAKAGTQEAGVELDSRAFRGTRLARSRRRRRPPRIRRCAKSALKRHGVQLVAALDGAVEAVDRRACERKVADRIEHLVADELVRVAQALRD